MMLGGRWRSFGNRLTSGPEIFHLVVSPLQEAVRDLGPQQEHAAYLQRQLDDFASGTRDNPVMKPVATALSEAKRKALAEYYSKMPIPPALATPTTPMPGADSVCALLATRGRLLGAHPATR